MKLTPRALEQHKALEAQMSAKLAREYEQEIESIRRDLVKMFDARLEKVIKQIDEFLSTEIPKEIERQLNERSQG